MKIKGNNTNLELDKAGNLVIKLTRQGKKFAKELLKNDNQGSDSKLWNLLEEHLTNGWEWIRPEEIGALTDAPILSNDAIHNDQGELTGIDKCYAYMDYQIYDPIEELVKHNGIVFMDADNC
jgi:hypothetical protein